MAMQKKILGFNHETHIKARKSKQLSRIGALIKLRVCNSGSIKLDAFLEEVITDSKFPKLSKLNYYHLAPAYLGQEQLTLTFDVSQPQMSFSSIIEDFIY
ncbi:hypothetical protein ACTXT7_010746 [Hymenolepis weldensis]